MFGKHFDSTYSGSLIGAGCPVFAVWGYVIANQRPDTDVGAQVELNPKLLAFILGSDEVTISEAVAFLCRPDERSRSKEEGGRRLIRLGEFDYRVVNGAKYLAIRDQRERRIQNRLAKRRERLKRSLPTAGEVRAVAAESNGDTGLAERIAAGEA